MSGHTPGPWTVRSSTFAGEVRANNKRGDPFIAQCVATNGDYISAEANARLIAAAPDLLEAAKDALETLEIEFPGHPYSDMLRAAITKAEGQASDSERLP